MPLPLTRAPLARPGGRPSTRTHAKRVRPDLPQLARRAPLASDDDDENGGGPSTPTPTTDWGALAMEEEGAPSTSSGIDPDVAASINELSTIAARAMLNGDERTLRDGGAWRREVMALGDFCTRQARGNGGAAPSIPPDPASPGMQGALLAYLLLEMAEGRWPAAQADALLGPWRVAAEKLHGIVEDAGWKLSLPDEEVGEDEGVASGGAGGA